MGGGPELIAPSSPMSAGGTERRGRAGLRSSLRALGKEGRGRAVVLSDQRQADLHEGHAAYLDCCLSDIIAGEEVGDRVRCEGPRFCAAGGQDGLESISNPPWLGPTEALEACEGMVGDFRRGIQRRHICYAGVFCKTFASE
jgi:hypothetical protein